MSNILYTYRHHLQMIHDHTMAPAGTFIAGMLIASLVTSHSEIKGGSIPQRIRLSRPISIGEVWLACLDAIFAGRDAVTDLTPFNSEGAGELIEGINNFFSARDQITPKSANTARRDATFRRERKVNIERASASMLALHLYESASAKLRGDLILMYLEYATTIRFVSRKQSPGDAFKDAVVFDSLNPAHTADRVLSVESVCLPGRGSLEQALPRFWGIVLSNLDALHVPEDNDLPKIGNPEGVRASAVAHMSNNHTVSEAVRTFAATAILTRHCPTLDIVTYDLPSVGEDDEDDAAPSHAPDSVIIDADAYHANETLISRIEY